MAPTIRRHRERIKHLSALTTETERKEQQDARDKIKTAEDADVPQICEQLLAGTRRLAVLDTKHSENSQPNFCNLPAAGLRNCLLVQETAVGSLGDWDFRSEMKSVDVPALVLEGTETNVPLEATKEWARSLPNSRLLLIPHAGHANWVDQLEAVISVMDEFFHGRWPVGSSDK